MSMTIDDVIKRATELNEPVLVLLAESAKAIRDLQELALVQERRIAALEAKGTL